MASRDPFANFERMRRDVDALFGDVLQRRVALRRGGFSPAVDVYLLADPPRAVVRAELAGVDPAEVELEVRGRELVLAGRRRGMRQGEPERAYQQLEIEYGAFHRVVALGAEVVAEEVSARYEDGMLVVELPLAQSVARTVPVQSGPGQDA